MTNTPSRTSDHSARTTDVAGNPLSCLPIEPLDPLAFAPFGDVIEAGTDSELINAGTTDKYADLARLDLVQAGGRGIVSLYHARPYPLPHHVELLERHPHSSQLFMPLGGQPMIVIVAPAGVTPAPDNLRAFISNGRQGVNYRSNVWHHPCMAYGEAAWFLVLEREGPDENCDLHHFAAAEQPCFVLTEDSQA